MLKKKSKATLAARVISTLFVPPSLLIIIFTFFAFYYEQSFANKMTVLAVSYFFGFICPTIMFFYFRRKGKIIDLDASVKEERTVPYFIAVLTFIVGWIILVFFKVNIVTSSFWFCYISNTLIVIFINRHWKISAHALGVAGPLGAITFSIGPKGLIFLVLLLMVGWSRIELKRHSLAQVIAGSILGFTLTYFQMSLIISNLK